MTSDDVDTDLCVAAFYRFSAMGDDAAREALRVSTMELGERVGLRGTILIAPEGLNATIAGTDDAVEKVIAHLETQPGCAALRPRLARAPLQPFRRLKVELKPEIVTFRQPDIDPNARVGTYVAPSDWGALISDPDVKVIDTRNDFEVALGTFVGAENPGTRTFTEFAAYVDAHLDPATDTKVAMFCTGGIRCEKATSYLLQKGFREVFHLKGGILGYLEEIPEHDSLWRGECFVFDERTSVVHGLKPGGARVCFACYGAVSEADAQDPAYEVGVSCRRCFGTSSPQKLARLRERQRQLSQRPLSQR